MTALSLLRLLPPGGRLVSGSVRLDGSDLVRLPEVGRNGGPLPPTFLQF